VVGDLGPKLYEGDRQDPEGVLIQLRPELMNPNSNYYLTTHRFPNSFDKAEQPDGSLT